MLNERILREEELSGVSGGVGERSFAALAEDFARINHCDTCPNRNPRRPYRMCTEEYNRLLVEWSGGTAEPRCKREINNG